MTEQRTAHANAWAGALTMQVRVVADYCFSNLDGTTEQERVTAALEILRSQQADHDVQISVANQHMIATVATPDGRERQYEVTDSAAKEVSPATAAENPASQALLPMVLVTVDQAGRVSVSTDSSLTLCIIDCAGDEQRALAGICQPTEFSAHLACIFRLAKRFENSNCDEDKLQLANALNKLILPRRQ